MSLHEADLTGAFAADLTLGCETGEPMGEDIHEPCSCEEALALRAQLMAATAGTVALHVVKSEGYWTVERWRDGALVESYVGAPNIAEALVRIGDWMRATENQGE
jgi:quinol monooxygenase YgiN